MPKLMQNRGLMLLVGVTILAVVAAIGVVATGDRAASPAVREERLFPELAGQFGDLVWLRLARGAAKTDFTAIGGRWVVVDKSNYPAAAARVRRLLLGVAELTLVEPKTERPELFARLDLDDPGDGKSTLVSAKDRLGKTVAELIVGKVRPDRLGGGNDGVYVRKPGKSRAWLARGSLDLSGDTVAWLDRQILDIAAVRIASLTLTGEDGASLTLRRAAADGAIAVADPPDDARFKDATTLGAPAGALAALDLDNVKPAADLPVPDSGVAHAVFATFDGLTVGLRLFRRDNTDWVAIDAAGSGAAGDEAKTIDGRVGRWAYAIPAARAKLLRTRLADLVEPAKGS